MTVRYAYLVVEQKRYAVETPAPNEAVPPALDEAADALVDTFPHRLRNALDGAARRAGYGSLTRLMRSPRTAELSTPNRAAHVQLLLNAGLLSEDHEVAGMTRGAVPDAIWEIVRAIRPDRGSDQSIPNVETPAPARRASTRFVDSWSLALHSSADARSIAIDPARAPGNTLPLPVIAETLDALASEGWSIVQISEDRAIDDAASISHVVRQRFLLSQGSGGSAHHDLR